MQQQRAGVRAEDRPMTGTLGLEAIAARLDRDLVDTPPDAADAAGDRVGRPLHVRDMAGPLERVGPREDGQPAATADIVLVVEGLRAGAWQRKGANHRSAAPAATSS